MKDRWAYQVLVVQVGTKCWLEKLGNPLVVFGKAMISEASCKFVHLFPVSWTPSFMQPYFRQKAVIIEHIDISIASGDAWCLPHTVPNCFSDF